MRSHTDPLLQPFAIKKLSLRNRVMSTSHAISYGDEGMPKERYQLYHQEKAKGGIGLTMFGGSSNVAPDSASVFGQLNVGTDKIIPYFQQFADRVHRHGSALMCQITHMGGRTHWRAESWLPVVAPSHYREPLHRAFSKEMDRYDIDRIVKAFGEAALRCREGGLDGIEVLGHGHLVGQFWSPLVNKRKDEFGGPLENRTRFGLMVLQEIRHRVGSDFIIGLRMMMGEGFDGGLTDADSLAIAEFYDRSGVIDFLNLNYGRADTAAGLANYMPGMQAGLSPHLQRVGEFRKTLSVPILHAGRITDVATARYAVREGLVDLIGMTRAHIADPYIMSKVARGEEERIRPCVGATYCSWQRRCIHNPAVGREATLPHEIEPAHKRKRVVIVGAGPGGLEAARVSASRGHDVTVFEAGSHPGGQVRLAARIPSRRDLAGIVDWRMAECARMGVTFRYNILADAAAVVALKPDYVVIASGGLPDSPPGLEGMEFCQTSWDAVEAPNPDGTILVFDAVGTIVAPSYAETLLKRGADLIYVTPDLHVGQEMSHLDRPFLLKNFYAGGAKVLPDSRVVSVRRQDNRLEAVVVNEFTNLPQTIIVDHVIVEAGTMPVTDVFDELRPRSINDGVTDVDALAENRPQNRVSNADGSFVMHRIGDAVASRDVHAAILDALRICKDF